MFAEQRRTAWPDPDMGAANCDLADIYLEVKNTGLLNVSIMAKRILPTRLNIWAWEAIIAPHDQQLVEFVKYGFPMGYVGPVSDTSHIPNHQSAHQFPQQVGRFIEKELNFGGLVGPLAAPPFMQWSHVSPLMSRPKTNIEERRVITDLTYPRATSVNSYIRKNTVMGMTQSHCLLSVDAVVQRLQEVGPEAHMFTIDISRAYKNFRSCPLDWPLLALTWNDYYYLDVTMPFGWRASSGHM